MAESPRNPDALEQEIERTRDELARTIDTIADRVSPKNVAKRSMDQVKENAASVRQRLPGGDHSGGSGSGDFFNQLSRRSGEEGGSTPAVERGASDSGPSLPGLQARTVWIAGVGLIVVVTTVIMWRRKHG